jgi:hypothetical protein
MGLLSTEMDENIIQRLPKSALNNLSKTSRYYRSLAEPHLYRNLVLSNQQPQKILRLFFTILRRNGLATHIRNFRLTRDDAGTQVLPLEITDELMGKTSEIKEIIKRVAAPLGDPRLILEWFGSICQENTSVEDVLSVIWCLATNLEGINVAVPLSNIQEKILGFHWMPVDHQSRSYPFCNLKRLQVQGSSNIAILPPMEQLTVTAMSGWNPTATGPFYMPYRDDDMESKLHTLWMVDVCFEPEWIERAVAWPEFAGLKDLRVCRADDWRGYDFTRLSEALVTHLPDLEHLEWSSQAWDKEWGSLKPIGSLVGFTKLTTLIIDYRFLTARIYHEHKLLHLLEPQTYLPASLQSLHITDTMKEDIRDLSQRYLKRLATGSVIAFLAALLNATQISDLTLSITMELSHYDYGNGMSELPRHVRKLLPQLVSTLEGMGISLSVWRSQGQASRKLLYEPGYEAPWPHLGDVDQEH